MIEVPETDVLTISRALKDVLVCCFLPLRQCSGQAYDGASNRADHLAGVATRLQREEPKAHYVHCLSLVHNMTLAL